MISSLHGLRLMAHVFVNTSRSIGGATLGIAKFVKKGAGPPRAYLWPKVISLSIAK